MRKQQSETQAYLRLMAMARHDPAGFEYELDEAGQKDGTDVEQIIMKWPEYGIWRVTFTAIALSRGDYRLAQRVLQTYRQQLEKTGSEEKINTDGYKELQSTLDHVSYDIHASDSEMQNRLNFLRSQSDGERVYAAFKTPVFKNLFMSGHTCLAEEVLRSGGVDLTHSGFPEDDVNYWHARVEGWAALYADENVLLWLLRNGIDPWSARAPASGRRLVDYLDWYTKLEFRKFSRPRFEEFMKVGHRIKQTWHITEPST